MNAVAALRESDPALQLFALRHINTKMDEVWSQASPLLSDIEQLFEDASFPHRDLAALVASKIYYHLVAYSDSLHFALQAGALFDISSKSDYVCCIVGKCLDEYVKHRQASQKPGAELEKMFNAVMESWIATSNAAKLKDVLGICVEARRLDLVERCLTKHSEPDVRRPLLKYCLDVALQHIYDREFRQSVLKMLVKLFQTEPVDYLNAVHCLIMLRDFTSLSGIIVDLVTKAEPENELAYSIGFDLYIHCPPAVHKAIIDLLLESPAKELDSVKKLTQILSGKAASELYLQFLYSQNQAEVAILTSIKKVIESRSSVLSNALVVSNSYVYCGTSIDTFLRENLEWLGKASNWAKFTATASLGLIYRGHVKKSLDLLAPYLTYSQGGVSSPYQEGGALYALGLIHSPVCHDNPVGEPTTTTTTSTTTTAAEAAVDTTAAQPQQAQGQAQAQAQGQQQQIMQYLLDAIRNAGDNEPLLHGACLGLGLTAMTLADEAAIAQLKNLLHMDLAVVGEAAAVGIGMVKLGSADSELCDELIQYGQETQHDKITRGIAMALALIMYGREDEADTLIDVLCCHKDSIFRCAGVFVLGLAYAGSANVAAVARLLNLAVTDVTDDVRRYAIAFLGFLTFKRPKYCIDLVRLLSDSYHPHTRYGVALAVGVACAGTGLKDAVELLERLCKDPVDHIRQVSYVSLAMVLVHQPRPCDRAEALRKTLEERIKDKHEELLTKLGCILATGILDAGGRNVTISLHRNSHNLMKSIVGMALFTQHWYWHPYLLLLSLTFQPSASLCASEEYRDVPLSQWKLKEGGGGLPTTAGGAIAPMGDEDQEPAPPEPFEWA